MESKIRKLRWAISLITYAIPGLVRAQLDTENPGYDDTVTNLPQGSIFGILTLLMQWLLGLISILAVISFVIAGIMYLTSAGDEDRIASAKRTMVYGIVGLVVALSGVILIRAVRTLLTGDQGATQF